MLYNEFTDIEHYATDAGLCALNGPVIGSVTQAIVDRYTKIYDHLATNVFSANALSNLYPQTQNQFTMNELSFRQKRFVSKADKYAYINLTGAPCPSVVGLKTTILEYGMALSEYGDFGARAERSLQALYKLLAELHNSDDALSSISTVSRLTSIDMHEKYRAKFNEAMRKHIGESKPTTETPYGNLVRSNKEMRQTLDHRNTLNKSLDEKTKDNVESLVKKISGLMDNFANYITAVDSTANGRVVDALSATMFKGGELIRDYGVYLHRVNSFIGAVDGIVDSVLKYQPPHIKKIVDDELEQAGLNSDNPDEIEQVDDILDAEELEALVDIRARLEEAEGITQADVMEIEEASPGLLSDLKDQVVFSPRLSKVGYQAGLNAIDARLEAGLNGAVFDKFKAIFHGVKEFLKFKDALDATHFPLNKENAKSYFNQKTGHVKMIKNQYESFYDKDMDFKKWLSAPNNILLDDIDSLSDQLRTNLIFCKNPSSLVDQAGVVLNKCTGVIIAASKGNASVSDIEAAHAEVSKWKLEISPSQKFAPEHFKMRARDGVKSMVGKELLQIIADIGAAERVLYSQDKFFDELWKKKMLDSKSLNDETRSALEGLIDTCVITVILLSSQLTFGTKYVSEYLSFLKITRKVPK